MNKTAKTIKEITLGTCLRFLDEDMPVYAANAALFLQIAAFPLLIFLLSLIRFIPKINSDQFQTALINFFPNVPQISALLSTILQELTVSSSGTLTWISAVITLFSASSGVFAIMKGLCRLQNTKPLPYIKHRLYAVFYTFSFSIVIVLGLGSSLIARVFVNLVYVHSEIAVLQKFAETIITVLHYFQFATLLATFVIILGLYLYPFNVKRKVRMQIPGAILSSLGWFAAAKVFSFYITYFYKGSVVYGSLTAMILLAFWMVIIMSILFLGAALNRTIEEYTEHQNCEKERKQI